MLLTYYPQDVNMNEKHTPISELQFNEFCDITATTYQSKKQICKSLGISDSSIDQYIRIIGELAARQYARAKDDQCDSLEAKIIELEEECMHKLECLDDPKLSNALVQAYKMQVDNIKWMLSKRRPRQFGDKLDITSNGNDITREILITPISNTSKPTATSQDSQAQ